MADYERTPHDWITGETPAAAVFDGLAAGVNAATEVTASVGSIVAQTTVITRALTANADRALLLIAELNLETTVADDIFRVRIVRDGTTTIVSRNVQLPVANTPAGLTVTGIAFLTGGAHTLTVTAERVTGTGTGTATASTTTPSLLVAVDIGPDA